MYAVIQSGGKQYRVTQGDLVKLELLASEPGDSIDLPVMMLGGDTVKIGTPLVEGVSVKAEVVGHGKDKKIYVNKFKAKSNYRRRTGHRQGYTEIRITEIAGAGSSVKKAQAELKPEVEGKAEVAETKVEAKAAVDREVVEAVKE